MFKTHAPIVKYLFEQAEECTTSNLYGAALVLSSSALEAALYRKLLPRKPYLKRFLNICNLENAKFEDLIEYAKRLGLLDSTSRETAHKIRKVRNCVVHLTNRNLKRLATKYPSILRGIKTRILPSGKTPPGEEEFKVELAFFALIKRISNEIVKDVESVLNVLDKR